MARIATTWKLAGLAFVALALALIAGAAWLAATEGGLKWVIERAEAASGGRLRIESVQGTLLGPIAAERIVFSDAATALAVERARLRVNWWSLLQGLVEVQTLEAQTIEVTTAPSGGEPPAAPQALSLPLRFAIGRFEIGRLAIAQGAEPVVVTQIAGSFSGGPFSHRLVIAQARTPWGSASADLDLRARAPFEVKGALRFGARDAAVALDAEANLDGTLGALRATLAAQIGEARAEGVVQLAPFEPDWLPAAQLRLHVANLASFVPGAPRSDAQIALHASGGANGVLQGRLELGNAIPGAISEGRIPLASLETEFATRGAVVTLGRLRAGLGAAGRLRGSGVIEGAHARFTLSVEALDLHAVHATLRPTRLAGVLQLEADPAVQRLTLELEDAVVKLAAAVRREGERITVESFRARAHGGELSGDAQLDLGGDRAFTANARARGFDPARLGDFPPAVLNGEAVASGALAPNWRAQLRVKLDDSRFRDAPLTARASFGVAPGVLSSLEADVRVGVNRLQARGGFGGAGDALDLQIDARDLAQLDPRAGGRIAGKARLEGSFERPGGSFEIEGRNVAFEKRHRLRELRASGSVSADAARRIALDWKGSGVQLPQIALASARFGLTGRLEAHDLVAEAKGDGIDLSVAASGGWFGAGGWRGRVTRLSNGGRHRIELAGDLSLDAAPERVSLGAATLRVLGGELALQSLLWEKGRLATAGRIRVLPVAPLAALAGWQPETGSDLALNGEWSITASPHLNGRARIERASGDLILTTEPRLAAGLAGVAIDARISDDVIDLTGSSHTARLGHVELGARISPAPGAAPGVISALSQLSGTLGAQAPSLAFLQPFIGSAAVLDGRVMAKLSFAGTLGAPVLTGTLALDAVRIDMPQHALALRDGRARIVLDERSLTVQSLAIRGGEGQFEASGGMRLGDHAATLDWRAERLRLFNRPDRQLVVSGAGKASLIEKRLSLQGELKADLGVIEIDEGAAERLGDDVVVTGRANKPVAQAKRALPLDLDMAIDAGERFRVRAKGLAAELCGRVRLRTREDAEIVAQGSLETRNGTYRAFGQELVIERGRLLFDGPVGNPGLDVRALRKNQEVEAGVEARGTVRSPVIRLVSEPAVSDQEKIAWLVLGHGAASTQGAEIALLRAAVSTLSGSDSGLSVGQNLARGLGLDEVGIRGGLGGHVVAFGKRLSDRVYLEYEQGLTVAATLVRLKLALTRTLSARAEASPQGGRVGFGYDISYD